MSTFTNHKIKICIAHKIINFSKLLYFKNAANSDMASSLVAYLHPFHLTQKHWGLQSYLTARSMQLEEDVQWSQLPQRNNTY